ncbi:MAG: GNAT family N-acetyltransferase [Xanthobacteraceae bacterium]
MRTVSTTSEPGLNARRAASGKLRTGRHSDAEALDALEREIFKGRHFMGHLISRASFQRFCDSPSAKLIVAQVGGYLSGYVVVLYRSNSSLARMYSIGVAARFRRRGFARRLLAAAEKDAIDRGRKAMRLEVRADDRGALAFYESSGYRGFGRRPGYYGGRVDALCFDKPLVEEPRRRS